MSLAISYIDTQTTHGMSGESPASGGWEIVKMLRQMGSELEPETSFGTHEQALSWSVKQAGKQSIVLGGDHSVTAKILEPIRMPYSMLVLDAHEDWGKVDEPLHAGNWQRHLLIKGFSPGPITCGIRGWGQGPAQLSIAKSFDKELPLYVSIDMDAFDPSVAPGVNWPVPGGFQARPVLTALADLAHKYRILGFDITEYVPSRDAGRITASLAAHCYLALTDQLPEYRS